MQLSPANLKELRMALPRRKKKEVVPAGIRSTKPASWARAPQRIPSLLAGKSKANELPSSGDSSEPATRRPARCWVRASARELIGSYGRTRCILQPAPHVPRGRGDVRGCLGRVRRPSSAKWVAHAHSHGFRSV